MTVSVFRGTEFLVNQLKRVGETRPIGVINTIIEGINGAAKDVVDPDSWMKLFKTGDDPIVVEQLRAYRLVLEEERKKKNNKKNPLDQLRDFLGRKDYAGYFITHGDEYRNEYLPACAERLEYVTGFNGSNGCAIVFQERAAFFTDGRYTIQAAQQVDKSKFEILSLDEGSKSPPFVPPLEWLKANMPAGKKFLIDPWLHTASEVKAIRTAVEEAGGKLDFATSNPIDSYWHDQPSNPISKVEPHPLQYSGRTSFQKRDVLCHALETKGADAIVLTMPEEICWLLNVRGGDVPNTPLALSQAIVHRDGRVEWFIDKHKITPELESYIDRAVSVKDLKTSSVMSNFEHHIREAARGGKTVWVDPNTAPFQVKDAILTAGGHIHREASPIQLMKAKKNEIEWQGAIEAHERDGVAITRFLAAISEQGAAHHYDEITAAELLLEYRKQNENFRGNSFDTISGAGGNGAIVHYRSTPETNQKLDSGPIYLVDSGGQYLDGTTDITRTIAVDTPNEEMREMFTLVLQGHIRVAMSTFPAGTTGHVFDEKARSALVEEGKKKKKEKEYNYAHGTGHGVGSYLSVHEGPCNFNKNATKWQLEPGMIISNEPGYYKTGEYGIRIENLLGVVNLGKRNDQGEPLLGFRTLTLAPIDRNLIEPSMMKDEELKWLNDYHSKVFDKIMPQLERLGDLRAMEYLKESTKPIRKPGAPTPARVKGLFL